jgi:hypothetical protein
MRKAPRQGPIDKHGFIPQDMMSLINSCLSSVDGAGIMAAESKQECGDNWSVQGNFIHDGIMYTDQMFSRSALEECKMFNMKTGDVLIASYPKTG